MVLKLNRLAGSWRGAWYFAGEGLVWEFKYISCE